MAASGHVVSESRGIVGKTLIAIIIGVAIAILVYSAFITLVNLVIWGLVALLALIASAALLAAQIILYWLIITRLGSSVRDAAADASLSLARRVIMVITAIALTALVTAVTELIIPGVLGRLLLPGIFAAAGITRWLVGHWTQVVPGFLGWQPALGLNSPAMPWSHPVLLAVVAVPLFMGSLLLVRSALNLDVLRNISFRPSWPVRGRNRWN